VTGVIGIVGRDRAPVSPQALRQLRETVAAHTGRVGTLAPVDGAGDLHFCAAGRLDARAELMRKLRLDRGTDRSLTDPQLLLAAYRRWGEDAPQHLIGDWSLVAWHPHRRRLFVARDPFGYGSLLYHMDARTIAFAPTLPSLLALKHVMPQLDELYLAQYLISWPAYHGPGTIFAGVKRLPPAHALTVTDDRVHVRCYRRLDHVSELRLARREDYVAALRAVFDEAVRDRLSETGPVAATLSGGLDSSSVSVTAARALRAQDRRLLALTSVPITKTSSNVGSRFEDESPFARAVAAAAGNIDLQTVAATRLSPIQAIRLGLEVFGSPVHAASNLFWLFELHAEAGRAGAQVLLTGQLGNASISWTGDPLSQPPRYQLDCLRVRRAAWLHLRRLAPLRARSAVARHRFASTQHPYRSSAVAPDFARRLRLMERRLDDAEGFPRTPLAERLANLKPGRTVIGDIWTAMAARHGPPARDPTTDVRVVEFTLSVPDRIFIDPRTGTDRWLIREAMRGRLPDEVRLNRARGLQASDLVPRLRACAPEVEQALNEVAAGPAVDYLDVGNMRGVWEAIRREDTPGAYNRAVTVLTRGLMAGLHVNAVAAGRVPGAVLHPS
jgi:asparagine synthase (glutamine-hydrolysing)